MPEYLSPGVYMEEFEIGAKPIEGVSTSTAGFVGITQKGPLNKPTLVTSMGEYNQIFGGYIDKNETLNYHYLPYAVDAYFANGGKRVYITRVASTDPTTGAKTATGSIPDISGSTTKLNGNSDANSITIKLSDISKLQANDILLIKDGELSEFIKYLSKAKNLILSSALQYGYAKDATIDKSKKGSKTYDISSDTKAGDSSITLTDAAGIAKGQALYIDDATPEICYVKEEPAGGIIQLTTPLKNPHAAATAKLKNILNSTPAASTNILSAVKSGSVVLAINPTDSNFNKDDIIKLSDADHTEYFIINNADADPGIILLDIETRYKHTDKTDVIQVIPAIDIEALNEGTWGNNLKITTQPSSINDKIKATANITGDLFEVNSLAGIELGTILKIGNAPYPKVIEIIKTDKNKIKVDKTVTVKEGDSISTEEFDVNVYYDNNLVEVFKNLSLDNDHSRFIEKIITDKSSNLIKAKKNPSAGPLPMLTQDKAPGWLLSGGDDGLPEKKEDIDVIYKGVDSSEPYDRKGLYTLKNIDDISIVAIPGITSQAMQALLINHCELMRYRFAVIDSEPGANLEKIQEQRNFYDSDYAALYYPWLSVFDPVSKGNTNVPPSGAMCGIYARSDVERGVQKAPANEVVSLALDLEYLGSSHRIITTGQQDILNPKGVNCIRVFPGRGIRVWGARTLTSDPLWKYINVRRTFIYLEKSIEQGTQWVVFEPNDIGLWARVKQTINQFLTDAWRSGMLMGATADEAFFVKCDRTTMSQGDIDNGRLICVIGVAPVKPAEFVIFRIAQWTGGAKN